MTLTNGLHQHEINNYFFIHRHIKNAYEQLEELRYRHENRNYYTRTAFHELGFGTQGFNIEREVNDFVGAERQLLDRIERLYKRKERFNQLLSQLPSNERDYLIMKYKQRKNIKEQPNIEEKALAIIEEMEEFKFKLSRYNRNRLDRAELFKKQQEQREELKKNEQIEQSDHEYSNWLKNIMADKELTEEWKKSGILDRLIKLEKSSVSEGDLQAT